MHFSIFALPACPPAWLTDWLMKEDPVSKAMECFNTLLLKLREVHEREVEGKRKFISSVYLGGMCHNVNRSVKSFMASMFYLFTSRLAIENPGTVQ